MNLPLDWLIRDDNFYATLAIAIEPGGASTQPQIPDRGKAIRINKHTGDYAFLAHGLRTPNGIAIGVDEEIFIADNQGDWLPSSKILHLKKGAFFGSRAVDPEGTKKLAPTLPVVWLPQDDIGNSPSQPSYINVGPYQNQLIYGEVTHGGVKRVFVEKIAGNYQGAVFRFTQGLEAGINRIIWGPDSALYVGGIGSTGNWGQIGKLEFGLQKLIYNGKTTFEMLAVRAKSNGVEIEFTEPLPLNTGGDIASYEVRQWWYLPTPNYGGPKMDEKLLKVVRANVSEDRKKVFLALEGMKEAHLVYIRINDHFVSSTGNELWTSEAWYTMNAIPKDNAGFSTTSYVAVADNTLSETEKAEGWQLLFDGKTTDGWRKFRSDRIGSAWRVKDGALTLDGRKEDWQFIDGGDIITEGVYKNYELSLEWKIAKNGNSGIIFNVVENDTYDYVWQTGPEMQVLDNAGHADAQIHKHRAGDLYDLIPAAFEAVNPSGEWNKVRLIVNNGKVEHWLNGHKILSYELWTDEWNKRVGESKFKEMPGFGKAKKGHISLQDHGDVVAYKNIKIRTLTPPI